MSLALRLWQDDALHAELESIISKRIFYRFKGTKATDTARG